MNHTRLPILEFGQHFNYPRLIGCGDIILFFRIGMEMQLELETLSENEKGQALLIHRFRPAGADPAAAASAREA